MPPVACPRLGGAVLVLLLLLAGCAAGEPDLTVGPARAGVPAGGSSQIVVQITNDGDGDDELVDATTPAAAAVELHRTEIDEGRASMTQLETVEIPAGESVSFRPGSLHLMMVLPDETVVEGGTFPLTLHFDRSGARDVDVEVVTIADLIDDALPE